MHRESAKRYGDECDTLDEERNQLINDSSNEIAELRKKLEQVLEKAEMEKRCAELRGRERENGGQWRRYWAGCLCGLEGGGPRIHWW